MSLRRRVLAYVALAAIASCALTTAVAVVLVRHRIASQRVAALETQANVLAVVGGAPGALTVGDHVYRVGTGRPRRVRPVVARAVVDAIGTAGDSEGTITAAGRGLLYVARTTARGRVVLIRSARLAFAEWRPFLSSLIIAGLGGAALAALLSFLLARRLLRPIDQLAGATRRLAAGETDVTVPVEGEDELAELGRSFNTMASELAQAREAQRRFLESVSHELKTPLTSIRGYAEALEEGAVSPAEGGRVVADEADRLQRLVFDLLDLARLGRAGFAVEHGPVDLDRRRRRRRPAPPAAGPGAGRGAERRRRRRRLGHRRRGAPAPGDVQSHRERAAPDAGGRVGGGPGQRGGDRGARHRARAGRRGPPAGLRALLPV